MNPAPTDTLAAHAHAYAASGLEIFPVDPATKAPLGTLAHNGMKSATTNPETITAWWTARPDALIGARIPKHLIVLDIDPRHGGLETWARILDQSPQPLPVTRTHASGRKDGGIHIWFKKPDTTSRLTDGGGIDILHHGHRYSILPPSPHPATGLPYEWAHNGPATPIADMPDHVTHALQAPPPTPTPKRLNTTPQTNATHTDSPADWFNWPWHQILTGWTLKNGDGDSDGTKWAHPTATADTSATIKHDCLFVYSPTPGLPVTETDRPQGLTKFRAYALLHHNGDLTAATHAIRAMMPAPAPQPLAPPRPTILNTQPAQPQKEKPEEPEEPEDILKTHAIKWTDFWAKDHTETDWLLEPLIAAGRTHSLIAPPKQGKSLLILEAAAALATGRPFLHQEAQKPIRVVYVDFEMTEADVHSRLTEFGYSEDDDLSNLMYVLQPPMMPMDTPEGGQQLAQSCIAFGAQLVCIDTVSRAVQGEENDAATANNLYRHTLMALKAAGIATMRLDHLGKDETRGARGSSAKLADVDIQYTLKLSGDDITIKTTARMGWVPNKLRLIRTADVPMHQPHPHHTRRDWDALQWISNKREWQTARQAAQGMTGTDIVTTDDIRTARRKLARHVEDGTIQHRPAPSTGGRPSHEYHRNDPKTENPKTA